MKRIPALLLALMLLAFSCGTAFAASAKRVIDDAELFTEGELGQVTQSLTEASDETGWDVLVYTNHNGYDIDNNLAYECDRYYNDNGFGTGANASGVMLTIDMGSRCTYILTKGDAERYFTDSRIGDLNNSVLDALGSGDAVQACKSFADGVSGAYRADVPDNGSYSNITTEPEKKSYNFVIPVVAGIIGVIVGLIFFLVTVNRYKHNGKYGTYDLNKNSSMQLRDRQDVFLTKHTTYTTDPPPQSSSGSSGGSSGGGSSHGGGGGRF